MVHPGSSSNLHSPIIPERLLLLFNIQNPLNFLGHYTSLAQHMFTHKYDKSKYSTSLISFQTEIYSLFRFSTFPKIFPTICHLFSHEIIAHCFINVSPKLQWFQIFQFSPTRYLLWRFLLFFINVHDGSLNQI